MIRARFYSPDFHPRIFPPPGPFWCTGYSPNDEFIIVAYLNDEREIITYWPNYIDLDFKIANTIEFTDRFEKPSWWL